MPSRQLSEVSFPQGFSVHVHIKMRAGSCMNVRAALVLSLEQLALIGRETEAELAEFAGETDVVFMG